MSQAIFHIQSDSEIPKYQQISDAVLNAIQEGRLQRGDSLPSINTLSTDHMLARETVVKAYKQLKEKGVLASRPGKGFYIATNHYAQQANVFLLFDVLLTPYKERLYNGIREKLKERAHLDFYYHHHNPEVFTKLLQDALGNYEYYVIMPFPHPSVQDTLAKMDQSKLLLLDIDIDYPGKECAVIRQSHNAELERALQRCVDRIQRYTSMTLVFPEDKNHPVVKKDAFRRFCRQHHIHYRIIPKLRPKELQKGRAYFVIEDEDLVLLVKYAHQHKLRFGRDLGVLSYNDTPFKEIIEGGISVVSIDFNAMGRKAAKQILVREKINLLQETELIPRGSL